MQIQYTLALWPMTQSLHYQALTVMFSSCIFFFEISLTLLNWMKNSNVVNNDLQKTLVGFLRQNMSGISQKQQMPCVIEILFLKMYECLNLFTLVLSVKFKMYIFPVTICK